MKQPVEAGHPWLSWLMTAFTEFWSLPTTLKMSDPATALV